MPNPKCPVCDTETETLEEAPDGFDDGVSRNWYQCATCHYLRGDVIE